MPHAAPIRTDAMHVRPRRRCGVAFVLALASGLLAAGVALAGPGPEYGPEAEARFLQRCEDSTGMAPDGCRRLSERLEAASGYEAYLEHAGGGPEAFARQLATRCLVARAVGRDDPGCEIQAAAVDTDR